MSVTASTRIALAILLLLLCGCDGAIAPGDAATGIDASPIDASVDADLALDTGAALDAEAHDAAIVRDADIPIDAGAACTPGGKARFVVTLGSLVAAERTNWTRIGTYTFDCEGAASGRVRSEHWRFNQTTQRHARELTGVDARDCTAATRDCEVRTAGTWSSLASAPESLDGTYAITGDTVTITWPGDLRESWSITMHPTGSLVRLTYASSSGFSSAPTVGFAYGSNAVYSTASSMADVLSTSSGRSFRFEHTIWNQDAVAQDEVAFVLDGFRACAGTACIGQTGCRTLGPGGGGCRLPVDPHWCDPGQSPMMYYIADLPHADRRNAYEFWTLCLAEGRSETCYTGNSHTRPMLQVIDDAGGFHGWVGIEMSRADNVAGDYIGVFRKADF